MNESERKWFYIAAVINIVVFFVLNLYSWTSEYEEFIARETKFSHDGYSWGLPFSMYSSYMGYPSNDIGFTPGVIFNLLALAVSISFTGMGITLIATRLRGLNKENHDL